MQIQLQCPLYNTTIHTLNEITRTHTQLSREVTVHKFKLERRRSHWGLLNPFIFRFLYGVHDGFVDLIFVFVYIFFKFEANMKIWKNERVIDGFEYFFLLGSILGGWEFVDYRGVQICDGKCFNELVGLWWWRWGLRRDTGGSGSSICSLKFKKKKKEAWTGIDR